MNWNKLTIKSQEVVQGAMELTQSLGQQAIEPIHLLSSLLEKGENVVNFVFGKIGIHSSSLLSTVQDRVMLYP